MIVPRARQLDCEVRFTLILFPVTVWLLFQHLLVLTGFFLNAAMKGAFVLCFSVKRSRVVLPPLVLASGRLQVERCGQQMYSRSLPASSAVLRQPEWQRHYGGGCVPAEFKPNPLQEP